MAVKTAKPKISRNFAPNRQGLLFSLLGVLILVEVLTVFAVLASQRFATERALDEYTHELLRSVVDETRENAEGFLRRAQDNVLLAAGVIGAGLITSDNPERMERYFLEQLKVIPQIDAIYFGEPNGGFIFGKRSNDTRGYVSKLINPELPESRRVTLVGRDADLSELSRQTDPDDRFDPRTRPWYKRATEADELAWTAPYVFFTSHHPGLSAASAVRTDSGEIVGVIGADVELSALSAFLQTQPIGRSGAAFVVSGNGDVLAHPHETGTVQLDESAGLRLQQLAEVDPIAAFAGDRLTSKIGRLSDLREAAYDRFDLGNQRYLSMFVPLVEHGPEPWIMGVYAPEDELARKIRDGQRESIFLGVAVSLLVVTAAIMVGMVLLRPIYSLQRQAQEDPLTGLLNRRSFNDLVAKRMRTINRDPHAISALMIDIDHFKPINDEYGHTIGDEVLQAVSQRLTAAISSGDLLARYGGEEFALLLSNANGETALRIAERLRDLIADQPFRTSDGNLGVTISIGVAERQSCDETSSALFHRADIGLLAAKQAGRNRVVLAGREARD